MHRRRRLAVTCRVVPSTSGHGRAGQGTIGLNGSTRATPWRGGSRCGARPSPPHYGSGLVLTSSLGAVTPIVIQIDRLSPGDRVTRPESSPDGALTASG